MREGGREKEGETGIEEERGREREGDRVVLNDRETVSLCTL